MSYKPMRRAPRISPDYDDPRRSLLNVRVAPNERIHIKEVAMAQGKTVSTLIREALAEKGLLLSAL